MFGYVLPCKPELRMREWQDYRAMYCGLCKQLGRAYGPVSRMALNYDLVLLALVADSLAGETGHACPGRCMAGPRKRPICQSTPGLVLAADALVLSVYYKLVDDRADESFFRGLPARLALPFAARWRKQAAARLPQADAVFAEATAAQQALEADGSQSADAAADPTARMTAALFAAAAPDTPAEPALRRMGLCLGKLIYYLDAAEDYEKDAKHGAYNVFLRRGLTKEQTVAEAQRLCRMCAGEIGLAYNLLSLQTHKDLLDNIIFLGLPASIANAGAPHQKQHDHD